ncbi:hypothetical protein DVK05_12995 [Halorubrum sp. Atlit-8R]|nr:hypothetical protein DVK08_14740 [Halorubrum sp. Atlit-9R]RLM77202.1 hypothetical protein DVK05_12995 [Halorubrum sp. Atlit-8R]
MFCEARKMTSAQRLANVIVIGVLIGVLVNMIAKSQSEFSERQFPIRSGQHLSYDVLTAGVSP